MKRLFTAFCLMVLGLTTIASAQDTATLKLKIVVDGKAPDPAAVPNVTDPVCAAFNLKYDSIAVGAKGELANFVIFFDEEKSKTKVPEKLQQSPEATLVLDNKNCLFDPKVLVARPGQTITVKNSDTTGHNANLGFMSNEQKNFLVPAGKSQDYKLAAGKVEPTAMPVKCDVHPWMKAFIIVKPHPYVGVSNKDGVIEIKDLPVGSSTFRVWHEATKAIDSLSINGKPQKLTRNRFDLDLKPGVNDLGEVKVDAKLLQP